MYVLKRVFWMLRELGLEKRRGGAERPAGGVAAVQAGRRVAWTKVVEDTGMRWAGSRCVWHEEKGGIPGDVWSGARAG